MTNCFVYYNTTIKGNQAPGYFEKYNTGGELLNKRQRYYPWLIVVGAIISTGLVQTFATILTSLFVIPITTDFGIGRAEFAVNTSIISLCGCVAQITIGQIYTKYKIKWFQTGAVILLGLVFIARSMTQNIFQQYICSFVAGFLTAPVMLGNNTMITRWFRAKRGTAISIMFAGQGIFSAIASPIVSWVISNYSWRTAYLSMGILILLLALPVVLLVMKDSPADVGLQPYGADSAGVAQGKGGRPAVANMVEYTLSEAMRKPFFYMFAVACICMGLFSNNGSMSQVVPSLTDVYGSSMAATYLSIGSIVTIGTNLLYGWLTDKFGVRFSIILGYLCTTIFFVSMMFIGGMPIFYLLVFLYANVTSVGTTTSTLIASETFGPKNFSMFFGLSKTLGFIGGAIGGVVTAFVFDFTGTYNSVWVISAILAVLVLVLFCSANKLAQRIGPVDESRT